jgi:hypothetical protein
MQYFKLSLFILTILGCQLTTKEQKNASFRFPKILNSQINDTLNFLLFDEKSISSVFPRVVGKFRFSDSIDINPQKQFTLMDNDFVDRYKIPDDLYINGLELLVDYNSSVKFSPHSFPNMPTVYVYYPVYFVNSTESSKIFFGKDSYAFGIQEALNFEMYEDWKPVEEIGADFCDHGHWGLIVHPQEFVLVLMRKYHGEYETQLQVKFEVGENIITSGPFIGRINKSQFLPKEFD